MEEKERGVGGVELEYLNRFVRVGELLSFSAAAEELFISQPALSHSIRCMEKELGALLLERSTKAVRLTEAGERFLPAAREIISRYREAVQSVGGQELCIGYIGPAMDSMFSPWIRAFCRRSPATQVQIRRYPGSGIGRAIDAREIQLTFLYEMNVPDIPGVEYRRVGCEKFRLALSATHPLAAASHVEVEDLRTLPFLLCERSFSPHYFDRIMAICRARGFTPRIVQTVRQISDDLYRLVSADIGAAIVSWSGLRPYEAARGVRFLDFGDEEDLLNPIVAAWKGRLSPAAALFRDIAVEMAF